MERIVNTNSKKINITKLYSQNNGLKPVGLWYAINNEWVDWCLSQEPDWIKSNNILVEIDEGKVLTLKNTEQIKEFIARYKKLITPPIEYKNWLLPIEYINWFLLAQEYAGIEIQNYHEIKFESFQNINLLPMTWFFAWDVSGGCIWDLSIIKKQLIKIQKNE